MYKTQKARGLELAATLAQRAQSLSFASAQYHVITAADDSFPSTAKLSRFIKSLSSPQVMVRPAPNKPRHGFVDSRPVAIDNFAEELSKVRREVVEVEPEAEIIFMPFIPAEYNYIISSAGVTIGTSYDGATAGKNVVFIPASSDLRAYLQKYVTKVPLEKAYGIAEGEDAYIEAVSHNHTTTLTQVRAGPIVGAFRDYIPRPVTVSEIITPTSDDLLLWEKTAAELRGKEGVVVWHDGGAVSCHFGVHCAINEIPYITTEEPALGETLEPMAASAWGDEEYAKIAHYIAAFSDLEMTDRASVTQAIGVCVATLHSMVSLQTSNDEGVLKLVGFSLANLPKIFTALAVGEARHFRNRCGNDLYKAAKLADLIPKHGHYDTNRESAYINTLGESLSEMPELLGRADAIFRVPSWGGSGYGGFAWANCTGATLHFLKHVLDFSQDRSQETFGKAVSAFNVAVNMAHNNGWWLNKYVEKSVLDILSVAPVMGMAKPLVYQLALSPAPHEVLGAYLDPLEFAKTCYDQMVPLAQQHAKTVAPLSQPATYNVPKPHYAPDCSNDEDDDGDDGSYDSSDDYTPPEKDNAWYQSKFGMPKATFQNLNKTVTDVKPFTVKIKTGQDFQISQNGHLQIPGDFPGMNRPWGHSANFYPHSSGVFTMSMTYFNEVTNKLYNLALSDKDKYGKYLAKTLNTDSSTQYLRGKFRLDGHRILVNIYMDTKAAESDADLVNYVAKKGVYGFSLNRYHFPEIYDAIKVGALP